MAESSEWYTPAEHVDAARRVMGTIDLDPASCAEANEVVRATEWIGIAQHGLTGPWHGRTWLNPPYGRGAGNRSNQDIWSEKLQRERDCGHVSEAILLVHAVPDRLWFHRLWRHPVCFTRGRLNFWGPDDAGHSPRHGSAFVYFGPTSKWGLFGAVFAEYGHVIVPGRCPREVLR